MARLVTHESGTGLLKPVADRALWSVLIPAAGRGSRLTFDKPKILFPVGGVTILERLTSLLRPFCAEFIFVLSPSGQPEVEPEIQKLLPGNAQVAIQAAPKGMADAIASGLPKVKTPNVA